jgi:hypothetical protein
MKLRKLLQLSRDSEERGSLAMAMLLTLVGTSLTSLLIPLVVSQINSARNDIQRLDALNAAQAGIDAALGRIRAATDSVGVGLLSSLPCFSLDATPLVGTVSRASRATYTVAVNYFSIDPLSPDANNNVISCSLLGGAQKTPAYAQVTSIGQDVVGGNSVTRTLTASYIFQTTNQNIAGGLVHVYKTATSTDLCLDAGTTAPSVGTPVTMQPCSPGNAKQKFAYNSNLTLSLTSSISSSNPQGMCLDAGTPHANGSTVVFQTCGLVTKPQQQWSINDSANFEGTSNGSSLDGYCFNVQTPNTAGSLLVLSNVNCKKGYDNVETWSPDASVGAGASGATNGQLVDFSQFGRCLDVTEQNVNKGFLIVWPCKQAPNPSNVSWNQKWTLPTIVAGLTSATGRITTKPNSLYCLTSPGSTAAGQYVSVQTCPASGTPTNMTWTVYANTGTYLTSYRVVDGYGNCLAPTDPNVTSPDLYQSASKISKVVVAPCNGDTSQKWDAPPNILQPLPLKDIREN